MQPHPTTLVGTTPHSTEAAFRVLGRGGKARALRIAKLAQQALEEAGQPPSDGVDALIRQLAAADSDAQVVGKLEAIGLRVVARLQPVLAEAKKNGIDFARALEERLIAVEKEEFRAATAKQLAEAAPRAAAKKAAAEASKAPPPAVVPATPAPPRVAEG